MEIIAALVLALLIGLAFIPVLALIWVIFSIVF